jgi:hypothetical protein
MKYRLIEMINNYKELIKDEEYDFIIEEMLSDLKNDLLNISDDKEINLNILETFHNLQYSDDIINELTLLEYKIIDDETIITEGLLAGVSKAISKMKLGFGNKHEKIIKRDKKWLDKNKKQILQLNYDEIELEVLSDYKVTFEQLLNRHNIFDKIFVNSENHKNLDSLLNRFADKKDNLKNGLDNYFRTGTSRKEIGLRKVSGDEAKAVVENMIAYCESFLSGRKFIEEKLNKIVVELNDVKESYIIREADELDFEDDNFEDEEQSQEPEQTENKRSLSDRQVGAAVLLTVAEARYFDYINILKGLAE